jgi:transposase
MLKCGGRWQDCPSEYGPSTTVYDRCNRSSHRGIWARILAALPEEGWIAEAAQIDSSHIKAHRCAGGGKGGLDPMPLASCAPAGRRRFMRSSTSSGNHSAS